MTIGEAEYIGNVFYYSVFIKLRDILVTFYIDILTLLGLYRNYQTKRESQKPVHWDNREIEISLNRVVHPHDILGNLLV